MVTVILAICLFWGAVIFVATKIFLAVTASHSPHLHPRPLKPPPAVVFPTVHPAGPGIVCRDGWVSHSSGRGTCSHHGGER
jgi:hypothetical protein